MKQFKLSWFIEPQKKFKIVTPLKIISLRTNYKNKFGYYPTNSLNLNLRTNYRLNAGGGFGSWNRNQAPAWCHGSYMVGTADLTALELNFGIKFLPTEILMPPNLIVHTNKTPFNKTGVRFHTLVKENPATQFKKTSFIVSWTELKNLVFEEL